MHAEALADRPLAPCDLGAAETAAAIRARTISPLEAVESHLERIERVNPRLNAYVTVLGDEARDAAVRAGRALREGCAPGPLHGVPVAIKDLFDFKAGVRNTFGCLPLRDYVPGQDALHVARLESAGAIVLGKTNTCELGHKGATDSRLLGPTETPFAPGRNAGGSSGGSAAAVAARMATVALGSDGAGSVRIPAAFCGVFGLKPTSGRVAVRSRPNAFRAQLPLAQQGVLARRVLDAAVTLEAIAGPDPRDPLSVPAGPLGLVAAAQAPTAGLRVAWSPDLGCGFPVEPSVMAVAADAAGALELAGIGVDAVDVDLGHSHHELNAVLLRALGVLFTDVFEGLSASQDIDLLGDFRSELSPELVDLVAGVQGLRAVEARADDRLRTRTLDGLEDVLVHHDAIVTPTVGVPPFPNAADGGTIGPSFVSGQEVDPLLGWALTYPVNFCGHPAASVPAGVLSDGSPVGIQVIGRRFEDATVVRIAAALERVRPWADTYAAA